MNLKNIKEEQKKLLNILVHFKEYCDENNIKFFLFAGTELGAVREHGFIPWDGDVDLMMSYDEYKRLEKCIREKPSEHFVWVTHEIDRHIPNLYAKLFEPGVNSEHLEDYSYIEICPFTGIPKSKFLGNLIGRINLRNFQIFWVKNRVYKNNMKRRHNQIGALMKTLFFWYPNALCKYIFKHYTDNNPYKSAKEASYIICPYTTERMRMPMSWFEEEAVMVDFEGYKMPVLKHYDEHLTRLYGDYMTPVQFDRYKQ